MISLFKPAIGIELGNLDCVLNIIKQLHNNGVTYDQAEEIAKLLLTQIKQTRECHEYNTCADFMIGNKTRNLGNAVIDYDVK